MIAVINSSGAFLLNSTLEESKDSIKNNSLKDSMVGWLFMGQSMCDMLLGLPIEKCLLEMDNKEPLEYSVIDFIHQYKTFINHK